MKKYLLFWLIICSFSSNAQMNPQWINHFCCFDSIAPHSFSYPFGKVVSNDSVYIAYYEDDTVKVKIVDLFSGNDLSNFILLTDSVLSSYYYGGDFKKCSDGFLLSNAIVQNGQHFLLFNKIINNFAVDSIGAVSTGYEKPTKMISVGDTSFYFAFLSDSVYLININTSTNTIRKFSYDDNVDELYPEIYSNSLGELILVERSILGANLYEVLLKRIRTSDGAVLDSTNVNSAPNYTQAIFQKNDSIFIAYNNYVTQTVRFTTVDLINLNPTWDNPTNCADYGVINFEHNSTYDEYYIETYNHLVKINSDYTIGFIKNLFGRTYEEYNQSSILFDTNDNPIIYFSFQTNGFTDAGLIVLRIDKNSGNTIDSLLFNDLRNTPDIAIAQFFDNQNKLNLLFANDYDYSVVLQEETQLNLIRLNSLSNSQQEIKFDLTKIFPNPAINKLNFSDVNLIGGEIKICDTAGKILKKVKLNSNNDIDISDLKAGLYFMQFENTKKEVSNARFIKVNN